jgi:hypothetical protein
VNAKKPVIVLIEDNPSIRRVLLAAPKIARLANAPSTNLFMINISVEFQ